MPTSPRILRAEARQISPVQTRLAPREHAQRDRILDVAQGLLAFHGLREITFNDLALALEIAPTVLRRHFVDLDALLAEILRTHLNNVSKAIEAVPSTAPDALSKRRAAYIAATRDPSGALTEAHALLQRETNFLPPDERIAIERIAEKLLAELAGPHSEIVRPLLDAPGVNATTIERLLSTLGQPQAAKPAAAPPAVKLPTRQFAHARPRNRTHALSLQVAGIVADRMAHAPLRPPKAA